MRSAHGVNQLPLHVCGQWHCRDLTEATLHGAGLSLLAAFIMVFLLVMVSRPAVCKALLLRC